MRCIQTTSAKQAAIMHFGVATLELVFCLPILFTLIIGVVWLGSSVIAQTEVTLEARHKTWSRRDQSKGTALLFLKDDIVSDGATQTVEVSPLFDDADSPESSHDVMVAAWDFEQLPLDRSPNWKQYAIAAANAKTGTIQNRYVDATNQLTEFKSKAGNIWKNLGATLIREISQFGESASSALEGGDRASEQNKSRLRSQFRRNLDTKKTELQGAKKARRNLDDDASAALKKVLKNRVARLKAEIKELQDDLNALDD
ncbi:MAG: TadE family protein [Planctomycetota bacterium]